MLKFNPLLPRKPPVIVRYEVAVLPVTAALIIALFLDIHWMPASGVLFLCAFMFIAWYGGLKPTLLAMSRSLLAFKYYLATSLHSLTAEIKAIPRILVLSLALVSTGAVVQAAVETPRTIRVVMDNAYAPYSFQSAEGKLQGILIDQWQAWEKKTGIKVELHAMDWGDAVRRMRAGEFDVIDSIVETPERRDYFDFTPAYTPIEASIFFRNDISGITDLASLKGFPVGVKAGDQHVEKLKEHGITTVILFQNNEAIIESAKERKINVFVVDDPSALYLLNKMGIEAEFRHSAPIFRDELRRAVRKGDAVLLRAVSEGFAAIAPGELKQIDEKWFGRTINNYVRYFTYAGYTAAVTILLIAVLVGWNRTLKRRILQRTAALGESEQRFRQIAENIHEVFWLATVDFSNILYISPAYEAVWGRRRESLYREPRSFFATIHPEDRSRVSTIIDRDREQGFEVEYRVVRPDGSIRWICDRGFPIEDKSGRCYRVAGIAEDITEGKRAEEETRRHATRMEARAEISQALAEVGLDVRTVLDTIARYTAEVIGDKCVIRLLSSDEKRFNLAAFHHPKPETLALMKSLYPGTPIAASHKWAGHVLRTRQPLLIPIVNQEQLRQITQPEYLPFVEQVGMHSILILPLCVDGRVIGSLALSRDHPEHPYTSDDQVFLQDLADRAALTIQNAQLFEQVQNAHQRLQSLSRSLLEVQETERRHIARELHDEIGQVLTGIKLSLERSAREPPDCVKSSVSQALGLVTELVGRVRDLSLELRPPMLDDLGLLSALKWQFGRYTSQFEIRVNFKHGRLDQQRFASDIETAAYRIVQEALTNVARHAGVGEVDVDIKADESRIRIRIRDEGVGFDAHTLSACSTGGLSGMRERASMLGGQFDVESAPGAGTLLRAELPLRMIVDNH